MTIYRGVEVSDWQHVSKTLFAEIQSGALASGDQLPTLQTLARTHGVTIHAARRAIGHLKGLGLIDTWHGKGSFVAQARLSVDIATGYAVQRHVSEYSTIQGVKIVSAGTHPAAMHVAQALGVVPGERLYEVTFVRLIDNFPVLFETCFLPQAERFEGLEAQLVTSGGMAKALQERGVSRLKRTDVEIRTRLPRPQEAIELEVPKKQPVLVTVAVDVDVENQLPLLSQGVWRGDRAVVVADWEPARA